MSRLTADPATDASYGGDWISSEAAARDPGPPRSTTPGTSSGYDPDWLQQTPGRHPSVPEVSSRAGRSFGTSRLLAGRMPGESASVARVPPVAAEGRERLVGRLTELLRRMEEDAGTPGAGIHVLELDREVGSAFLHLGEDAILALAHAIRNSLCVENLWMTFSPGQFASLRRSLERHASRPAGDEVGFRREVFRLKRQGFATSWIPGLNSHDDGDCS